MKLEIKKVKTVGAIATSTTITIDCGVNDFPGIPELITKWAHQNLTEPQLSFGVADGPDNKPDNKCHSTTN